jgi:hypothetical protein
VKLNTENFEDLQLNFVDGSAAFRFANVTNTTGAGVVGVSGRSQFKPLSGEPPYPMLDADPRAYTLLGVIPVSIVIVCTGFVGVLSRTVKDRGSDVSEDTASSLHDEQPEDLDTGDDMGESSKKSVSEQDDATDEDNPYGTNGDLCL